MQNRKSIDNVEQRRRMKKNKQYTIKYMARKSKGMVLVVTDQD